MAGESSSSITPQSPFSTLLEILQIMDNIMRESSTGWSEASNLLHGMKKDVLHIQKSLEKLRSFEQDLDKRLNPLASVEAQEGELQLSDEVRNFISQPRFHELAQAAQWFKNQLPPTSYYKFMFPESIADDPLANDSSSTPICNSYNNLSLDARKL